MAAATARTAAPELARRAPAALAGAEGTGATVEGCSSAGTPGTPAVDEGRTMGVVMGAVGPTVVVLRETDHLLEGEGLGLGDEVGLTGLGVGVTMGVVEGVGVDEVLGVGVGVVDERAGQSGTSGPHWVRV